MIHSIHNDKYKKTNPIVITDLLMKDMENLVHKGYRQQYLYKNWR